MALKPGDSVDENCQKVDSFPFSILKNPDDLALDPGDTDLQHTPPLVGNSILGEFEERDLEVCLDNEPVQVKHSPLQLSLKEIEDPDDPPDPDDPNFLWIGLIFFTDQHIREVEQDTIGGGGEIRHNVFPTGPGGTIFTWNTDMGDVSWDLINPPGMANLPLIYSGNGPFCIATVTGTVAVESRWNPENPVAGEIASVRLSGQHNLGNFDGFTGGGVGLVQCHNEPITFKTGEFGTTITFGVRLRWQWNKQLRCFPNTFRPPPGIPAPAIIQDPNDPNDPC